MKQKVRCDVTGQFNTASDFMEILANLGNKIIEDWLIKEDFKRGKITGKEDNYSDNSKKNK